MFGLIKTGIRLTIFTSIYSIIFAQITGFLPEIIASLSINTGMPVAVSMALLTSMQTLNWLFGPLLVNMAIRIWLFLPPIKLGIYFLNKASHM